MPLFFKDLPDELNEQYVCGKCMYLAAALHRRFGFPIEHFSRASYASTTPALGRGLCKQARLTRESGNQPATFATGR